MRPPILKLPNLSGYPRPPIGQLPTLQPSSIEFPQPVTKPRTTKLQPQGSGKFEENEERTSTAFPAEDAEANEIEGHTLSTKVAPSEAPQSQFIAMTFIPVAAVCILLLIFGAGTWFLRNRFCGSRKSKEDTVSFCFSLNWIIILFCFHSFFFFFFFNWEINPHLIITWSSFLLFPSSPFFHFSSVYDHNSFFFLFVTSWLIFHWKSKTIS